MKGIEDTRIVQDMMGGRLREARGKRKRPELVQLLRENPKAPVESRAEMTVERLKQWEYGNNPIGHEWIPAICEVLDCDVGYLFGEYKERKRELSDAHQTTGLSEKAVDYLHTIAKRFEPVGAYRVIPSKYTHSRLTVRVLHLLDRLITSEQFEDLFCELGFYMIDGGGLPDDVFNQEPVELTKSELNKFYDWMENRGETLTSRKEVAEMHLQTAADMFKNVFREVLQKEKKQRGTEQNG